MSDLRTVREHLASISAGAQAIDGHLRREGDQSARDVHETLRHIHGAIEALTDVVESALKKR